MTRTQQRSMGIVVSALALAILAGPTTVARTTTVTFTVTPTSDADCSDFDCDLQSALTVAESNGQDDIIQIAAGVYAAPPGQHNWGFEYKARDEDLEPHSLTIEGAGPGLTILDGAGASSILYIESAGAGADVTIRNITFQNAQLRGALTAYAWTGDITVEDCEIVNNVGGFVGAAELGAFDAGTIRVERTRFAGNSASGVGGLEAWTASATGSVVLIGNTFEDNVSTGPGNRDPGGVRIGIWPPPDGVTAVAQVIGNTFARNTGAGAAGGGLEVYIDYGSVLLERNRFENNVAGGPGSGRARGGGVRINAKDGGPATITGNLFIGNAAQADSGEASGGGLALEGSIVLATLTNNVFVSNQATSATGSAGGGGVYLTNDPGSVSQFIVTNNTFTRNSASAPAGPPGEWWFYNGVGGGLMVESSVDLDLHNNIVFGNTATGSGADIWVDDWSQGVGDFVSSVGTPVRLFNNNYGGYYSLCAALVEFDGHCVPTLTSGGNLNVDPLFVDADNGDIHLLAHSPVRDAGSTTAPALPSIDYEGDCRNDGLPDIGADEYPTLPCSTAATTTTVTCPQGIVYSGQPHEVCTASVAGPDLSEALMVTYTDNVSVGTATASASYPGAIHYYDASSGSATFLIVPAALTVTADDQSRAAGAPDPAFTFQISGFVPGEDAGVLSAAPSCGVAGAHDLPGTYPITCTGGAAANYTFSYVAGTLTVTDSSPTFYGFEGFFAPIQMTQPGGQTVWNVATAGIPVGTKWRLTLNGVPVEDPASFVGLFSIQIACGTANDLENVIESEGDAAGKFDLEHTGNGHWQFYWKTLKPYKGQCRAMYVKFNDGSTSAIAYFAFQ